MEVLNIIIYGAKKCGCHAISEFVLGHWAKTYPEAYNDTANRNQKFWLYSNNHRHYPPRTQESYPLPIRVISYERFNARILRNLTKTQEMGGRTLMLSILRDPINWLASNVKGRPEREIQIGDYRRQLTHFLDKHELIYPISFNRLIADQNYRQELIDLIKPTEHGGSPFTDCGMMRLRYGEGSSFDGNSFDGRALEMDLTNRWKILKETSSEAYYTLFLKHVHKYRDLLRYSEPVFGYKVPGEVLEDLRKYEESF